MLTQHSKMPIIAIRSISLILVWSLCSLGVVPYTTDTLAPTAKLTATKQGNIPTQEIQPRPESHKDHPTISTAEQASVALQAGFIVAVSTVLSGCAEIITEHPYWTGVASLTGIGAGIGIFFAAWRIFFPVSWFMWRLKTNDYHKGDMVIESLVKIGKPVVELLIRKLRDENSTLRSRVAETLEKIGDPQAVGPLIKVLEDESGSVRSSAVRALGGIGDRSAVEPLIKVLEDKDDYVIANAALALGEIGDPRAVEPLIKILRPHSISVYCKSVVEALGKVGDRRAIAPLRDLLARIQPTIARQISYDSYYPAYEEDPNPDYIAVEDAIAAIEKNEIVTEQTIGGRMVGWEFILPSSVPPFVLLSKDATRPLLSQRSWSWSAVMDEPWKERVMNEIESLKTKLDTVIETLSQYKRIQKDQIVSVYLFGSYLWTNDPNDIDLVFVVKGEQTHEFIPAEKLGAINSDILQKDIDLNVEVVGLETLKRIIKESESGMSRQDFIARRRAVSLYGAVLLGGMDLYQSSRPPAQNFTVLRDELLKDAQRVEWSEIKDDPRKIEAKRRWRILEASYVERMFGLEPKARKILIRLELDQLKEDHERAVATRRSSTEVVLRQAIQEAEARISAIQEADKQLADTGVALQEKQTALGRIKGKIERLEARLVEANTIYQNAQIVANEAESNHGSIAGVVSELKEEYDSAVGVSHVATAEAIKRALDIRQEELKRVEQTLIERQNSMHNAERAVRTITEDLESEKVELASVTQEIETLNAQIAQLGQTLLGLGITDGMRFQRVVESML